MPKFCDRVLLQFDVMNVVLISLLLIDRELYKIDRTSINGVRLEIDLNNGIKIENSTVLSVDISADNGIIYPIDRVISKE